MSAEQTLERVKALLTQPAEWFLDGKHLIPADDLRAAIEGDE